MLELPKRSDTAENTIYDDIGDFKDYELTQCVVYEMAIRNDENLNLINEVIEFYNDNESCLFDHYASFGHDKFIAHLCNLISKIDIVDIYLDELNYKDTNYIKSEFYDIFNLLRSVLRSSPEWYGTERDGQVLEDIVQKQGYSIFTQIIDDSGSTPSGFIPNKKDCITNGSKIITNFKRPKINVDNFKMKSLTLSVNVTQPMAEIISLVEHIQIDLEKDKNILKPPIKLLKEVFEYSDDLKVNKRLIADKFFAYDYFKIAQKIYEKENQKIYEDISKDSTLSKVGIKKKYKASKINIKNKIISDLQHKFILSTSQVNRYLDEMNMYIDDKKYKELITKIKY